MNRPTLRNPLGFSERLHGVLERRWFTNDGPLVAELEERLARYLGVRHCVLTCNGTLALQLAVRALDLKGEVIVPSFAFISLAHSLLWLGIDPVFCDIDRQTWNIDPKKCESLITPRTTAIAGVHLWGRPCDTRALGRIAARHGLWLLFDAAHALGCEHEGSMIGGLGDAEVFSFHATKVFHTFEGGAVTTNNDDLAARLRSMRNFGFAGYDEVIQLGTNAKMPEPSAAMGLANLDLLDSTLEENRRRYDVYDEHLKGLPGLRLLRYDNIARHNYQYVVLEVDEEQAGLKRDHLIHVLHSENVLARRYFYPGCHRMEPYSTRWPEVDRRLPNTNDVAQRVLVLPAGAAASLQHVREVCNIIRIAIEQADALRSRLDFDKNFRAGPYPMRAQGSSAQAPDAGIHGEKRRANRPRDAAPALEIRIPISPKAHDMRMLRYLLESLQEFGGPIGRAAHCVVSVGADEPPRDLKQEYEWTAQHSIDFHWVDRELFRRRVYDGTGLDRFQIESNADVVALLDVDLLIAGDFDHVVREAHRDQRFLGCIAHTSPFTVPGQRDTPSERWWSQICEAAGLPAPSLDWEHTGWGVMDSDPRHRRCPAYYNYGFVIAPRSQMDRIGGNFEGDLEAIDRVVETWFKSQIANTLAILRHGIRHDFLSLNYNFPLHVTADAIRALNPNAAGEDGLEEIRVFHYLGDGEINRKHFETEETVEQLLNCSDLSAVGQIFQRKLRIVNRRIAGDAPRIKHLAK